jgi:hypothetical protein
MFSQFRPEENSQPRRAAGRRLSLQLRNKIRVTSRRFPKSEEVFYEAER